MLDPDDVDLTIVAGVVTTATPELWMRATAADFFSRRSSRWLLRGVLGLRLAPTASPDHLGGWTIAENNEDWIRLEAGSWLMDAHLVLRVEPDGAAVASLVSYQRRVARLVWGRLVAPSHREELRRLLGQAARHLSNLANGSSAAVEAPHLQRWSWRAVR